MKTTDTDTGDRQYIHPTHVTDVIIVAAAQ